MLLNIYYLQICIEVLVLIITFFYFKIILRLISQGKSINSFFLFLFMMGEEKCITSSDNFMNFPHSQILRAEGKYLNTDSI